MRDQFAPVIEGFDCDGITSPWSFQSESFNEDGGNGGTMLDGTTVQDVLAVKNRFSWALNVLTMARYNALISALDSGTEPDTVSAIVYDPATDTQYRTTFHVTPPVFRFVPDISGATVAIPDSPLVLEETGAEIAALVSVAITAYPDRMTFAVGDTLDYTGLVVAETYEDGTARNVTPECTIFPAAGTSVTQAGIIVVTVSYNGASVGTFNVTVAAVVASGDGWTLYENGLLDIYYNGDMPNYNRTNSKSPWNDYTTQIKSATIRDSVTGIGNGAFYGCTSLTSVTIPDSVTSIGSSAFDNCRGLTSVTIPDSVTSIRNYAFSNCISLTSVTIPDSVTGIGNGAFNGCTSLTSVTIPDSVTSIRREAFYGCTSLTSVTIPDSVISIEDSAFSNCTSLTSVTIPDSVTSIGNYAFSNTSLTSVTINRNATVGRNAFPSGCVINYY